MKVVQINVTCGNGSTGVIATEIADLLKHNGHESYIAYGQGESDYPNTFKISSTWERKLHALINTRIWGEEGTGSICATHKLLKWIDGIHPDIVHIHTLHTNFLNYSIFFRYLQEKKIRVVWSFFDCWPFTGRCTHFAESGCRRWESECHDCPQLKTSGNRSWFFDKSQKLFLKKKQWFQSLQNLDIIVCSNWLKREVEKSICQGHPIHMIYNWIDMKKFKEIHDPAVYERYGLNCEKQIIVSVSALWDDRSTRLADAIRLAKLLPQEYQFVIIGEKTSKRQLPPNMIHIDYVAGTEELSKLYSCALAYVNFSVEDTFGKVMAEAQLCGTPAIVFDATACPEVVGDAGFVVPPHNVQDMLGCIHEIRKNGRDYYSQRCISRVKENFDYHQNVSKYLEVYKQILGREQQNCKD
ncbi:MAG: glycosyltransferase [Bacteroidaceae bacterium]|nr:glycosyltransferase [Bacteroidaceae bacterium]